MFAPHFLTSSLKTVSRAARRIRRALWTTSRPFLISDRSVLRMVAVTHNPDTKAAIRTAALQEGWQLEFVQSARNAIELLGRVHVNIVVYDLESHKGDWHTLCEECVTHGVCFQLVANMAADDLFLSVVSAGGLGLLCKPLTYESMIIAMRFARSLTEGQLTAAAQHPTS